MAAAAAEEGEKKKRRADKSPATLLCEDGGDISGQRRPRLHKPAEGNKVPRAAQVNHSTFFSKSLSSGIFKAPC